MRISMLENNILNAVAKCYPLKSSLTKLVKEAGRARNEILEVVTDLKKIGFVNLTKSNEVYLLEDGCEYLGIEAEPTSKSAMANEERKVAPMVLRPSKAATPVKVSDLVHEEQAEKIDSRNGVLRSIDELEKRLNKPSIEVERLDLKLQVLDRLTGILAEDIGEELAEIAGILKRVAA